MKTLKVKSILFSLLAVMAVAVFMTSCEQALDQVVEPVADDTAILEAILHASSGNTTLNQSTGIYEVTLNSEDLPSGIIDAISTKKGLVLPEDFLLSQEVASGVFCESVHDCNINDNIVIEQGIFEFESLDISERGCSLEWVCFDSISGYEVCCWLNVCRAESGSAPGTV